MWVEGSGRVGGGDLQGDTQSRKAGRRPGLFIRGKWHRRDEVGGHISAVHSELGVPTSEGQGVVIGESKNDLSKGLHQLR